MNEEFVIRGSLEESALPELLRSICKSKESGILTCFTGEYDKSIYIENGNIIFATSSNLDDRLGESLLRYGKITIRNFLNATKLVRPDKRLGALLCEQGSISPDELVEGVRTQVKDIIIGLFQATRGPYELVLKQIDKQEMIILNLTTEDIIFEGIKSIDSWSRISKGIGSFTSRLVPTLEADRILLNLSLLPEESHLYTLCNTGKFNVEEICGMSYQRNFETCRILWGLMMVGALEVAEQNERISESANAKTNSMEAESDLHDLVENYNDVYTFIYDYVFEKVGEEADQLASRAMDHVRQTMPNLAKDLKLDTYGRLDFDSILRNLSPIPESGRMDLVAGALEEIVYALLHEVGASFGPTDQAKLSLDIQKLRKV